VPSLLAGKAVPWGTDEATQKCNPSVVVLCAIEWASEVQLPVGSWLHAAPPPGLVVHHG
jgi:hypothetical protein